MRPKLRPVLVVAAVALAGCGAEEVTDSGTSTAPSTSAAVAATAAPTTSAGATPTTAATATTAAAAAGATIVPAVEVTDIATGQPVGLRSVVASDKPTLLWMWAPH